MPYKYVVQSKSGIPIGSTSIKEVADLMKEWADSNYPDNLPIPEATPRTVAVRIIAGPPRSIGDQGIIQYIHNFLPHYVGDRVVLAKKLNFTHYRSEVLTRSPPEVNGRMYVMVELDRGELKTHDQIRRYVVRDVVTKLARLNTRAAIADWMSTSPARVSELLWELNYRKPEEDKITPVKIKLGRKTKSPD